MEKKASGQDKNSARRLPGTEALSGAGDTQKQLRYLDIITASFSVCLVLSNIGSGAKIVDTGLSILGMRFVFDGGTLLFPISYILGDILTEVYGFKASRRVIWIGFACLVFSSLFFFALGRLPGEDEWRRFAGVPAYDAILGGMSHGGLVLASLSGYFAGEFSNSVILSRLKIATRGRFLFVRTISSTLAGEFLDTLLFISIACASGVFGWELFFSLLITNYILKCALEIALTPFTCLVCGKLKQTEAVDVYDTKIRYTLI